MLFEAREDEGEEERDEDNKGWILAALTLADRLETEGEEDVLTLQGPEVSQHADSVFRNTQQRLHLRRKLRAFSASLHVLLNLYSQ